MSIQAKCCYEVAVSHGKRVVIMEPVKGGSLANLPGEAEALLRAIRPDESIASWAIRFATDLDQVDVVLSGMNALTQVEDNMRRLLSLTEDERGALERCAEMIRGNTVVGCTGCGYCVSHCPKCIPIPRYFALYNDYARHPGEDWKMRYAYDALAQQQGKATDCIGCRNCEAHCPQKLEITAYLRKVADVFREGKP